MWAAVRIPGWPQALQPLAQLACRAAAASFSAQSHLGTSMPAPQSLDEIMKLDQLRDRTPEEVEDIWMQFHLDDSKGRAGAVLPGPLYNMFQTRATASPNFVLPLGKGPGKSLSILLQCQLPHVLFTGLEDFKQMGASAPPVMTVTHYPELLASHNLVLARADAVSPHVVSVPEARTLVALTHAFYSDPRSFLKVHEFNHEPQRFSYTDLLRDLGHSTGEPT